MIHISNLLNIKKLSIKRHLVSNLQCAVAQPRRQAPAALLNLLQGTWQGHTEPSHSCRHRLRNNIVEEVLGIFSSDLFPQEYRMLKLIKINGSKFVTVITARCMRRKKMFVMRVRKNGN